jgi:NADH dehydrogenase FAD-containing subunit
MPTIVIAGGGIAGLEALIALRAHLGTAARIELLEVATDLVERQRAVAQPFDGTRPRRFDLARIAADHDAHMRPDRLASVDTAARTVRTVRGDTVAYDAELADGRGSRVAFALPTATGELPPDQAQQHAELTGKVPLEVCDGCAVDGHEAHGPPLH